VYDPSKVTFTFNGVEIQGYPSEGFIGIQRRRSRPITFSIASDNEAARVGDLDQAEREGRQRFTSTVGRPPRDRAELLAWLFDSSSVYAYQARVRTVTEIPEGARVAVDADGMIRVAGANDGVDQVVGTALGSSDQDGYVAVEFRSDVHAERTRAIENTRSIALAVITEAHGYHSGLFDRWACTCVGATWWGDERRCLYCGESRATSWLRSFKIDGRHAITVQEYDDSAFLNEITAAKVYLDVGAISADEVSDWQFKARSKPSAAGSRFDALQVHELLDVALELGRRWRALAARPVSRRTSASRSARRALEGWCRAAHTALVRRSVGLTELVDGQAVPVDLTIELDRMLTEAAA
jgi:hypothetical protein